MAERSEVKLTDFQETQRQTLAQEWGIIVSTNDFPSLYPDNECLPHSIEEFFASEHSPSVEGPQSVQDLLNSTRDPKLNNYWNRLFKKPASREPFLSPSSPSEGK